MKFEDTIKRLSAFLAGLFIFILAAGFYLNFKGFGLNSEGQIVLLNTAHAGELPRTMPTNVVIPGGHSLGSKSAPIVIYEYSSLGCTHCADFHLKTLPKLKTQYIDKGLVRLVFVNLPLDKKSLKAALLSTCIANDKYFDFINMLFKNQRQWILAFNTEKTLSEYAASFGLSKSKADACMADKSMADKLLERRQRAIQSVKIEGTPTFVIADSNKREILEGALNFDELKPLLDKRLASSGKKN